MEIQKNLRLSLLFEFYGNLLTEKQVSVLKNFLLDDFSLSEIAEKNSSTRQGVNDLVKRSIANLEEYENKLYFFEKFQKIKISTSNLNKILMEDLIKRKDALDEV